MTDHIIAVDLGGTKIRVADCGLDGRIVKQAADATRAHEGVEPVFTRIVAMTRALVEDWSRVRGIGFCAPGPLDPWSGVILEAPNVAGMINFPIKARLEKELRVPVFVGNDANVAALGEQRFGAGRGVAHMIYMTISTGIGGGIIADNKLFLGSRGFAGEVGHQTLEAHGPRCNCGNVGCLEALAAGPAIARVAREAMRDGRASQIGALVGGELSAITATHVNQAARAGDALAREILERAGYYIGLGIVSLLHNFDTQLFVLGGGVAINAWDSIYPVMRATFDEYAMPSMRAGVQIVPAELGDDAGLLGAAALVSEQTTNEQ